MVVLDGGATEVLWCGAGVLGHSAAGKLDGGGAEALWRGAAGVLDADTLDFGAVFDTDSIRHHSGWSIIVYRQ